MLSGSGKYILNKQKPVHAFSEVGNPGSASYDLDREREKDRDKERERDRDKDRENNNSSSGSSRNRPPYSDRSPGPARNPFQSIVEESKNGIASNSSRSLPSSPVLFPTSPSVLSSPIAASQRVTGFDKEERSGDSNDNLNGGGGGGGGLYKRSSVLSGSGSVSGSGSASGYGNSHVDITNGELASLKRRTHSNISSNIYSGSDVGSGLDCDGDYEGDARGRHPYADRRHHDSHYGSGGRPDSGHPPINRNFSHGAVDDEDGEEPELDIIRSSPGASKMQSQQQHHHQLLQMAQQQDKSRAVGGSSSGSSSSSSSSSKPLFLKNSIDNMIANSQAPSHKTRLIHSASQSRIRPSSSADPQLPLRRPQTTSTSKSPTPRSQAQGRNTGRDEEENDAYRHGYPVLKSHKSSSHLTTMSSFAAQAQSQAQAQAQSRSASHKSTGRAPSAQSGSERERERIRGRSKDPVHRASPVTSKRDIVRIGPNQPDNTEDYEGEWQCQKCGDRNLNQFHCDSCATKRSAYSYAPGQLLRAPPK